jgi:glycosyltransferase involved in cell wall biosynthesis
MTDRPPRLLYLIPEDWNVCTHRLPLVRTAREAGFETTVVTRVRDHAAPIRETGADLIPMRMQRGYHGPLAEAAGLRDLVDIYRRVRPDIVHHVTPKSVLYGSIVARITRVPCVVNALAGLGSVYTSTGRRAALRRKAVSFAFRTLLRGRGSHLIVQNRDDRIFFHDIIGLPKSAITMIRGAGVDIDLFSPAPREPEPPIRFAVVTRLLGDKGIRETVEAARILCCRRDDVRIVIAGDGDPFNPVSISDEEIAAWSRDGVVEMAGRVDDVAGLLHTCHAALLPSYREGLPKALLEAAACGLPLIATDVPGCREICHDGVNGLLIPSRDVDGIVTAVEKMAGDPEMRRRMGEASRRMAVADFSQELVNERTIALYRERLADRPRRD